MPTTVRPMLVRPAALRVEPLRGRPVAVDLSTKVIRGYVMAQEGPFKSEGRGEFDRAGLKEIARLTNEMPKGLRSRFTHPGMSDDGLGKYLGRAKNAWVDQTGGVWKARADLHLSPSSFDTPSGDLGGYVLRLAAEDPDALSTSVVIEVDKEFRVNPDKTPMKGPDGEELPPLWKPKKLWATDVVDTGDAVDGMLSAQHLSVDDLPDALQRRGWEMLDRLFAGQPAEVVRGRCGDFLERWLAARENAARAVIPPATPATLAKPAKVLDTDPPPPARPNRDRANAVLDRMGLRRR